MAGYIGKSQGVTQVDGYNRTEADDRYVNASGDTMTGGLTVNGPIIGQSNDSYFGNYSSGAYGDIGNLGTSEVWLDARSSTLTDVPINLRTKGSGAFKFIVGSSEAMKIDSAGRVTMPYQPFFHAYMVANNNISSSNQLLAFDGVVSNIGGHYNNSTYRFTAPVSGQYFFSVGMRWNSVSSGYSRFTLRRNGVDNAYHMKILDPINSFGSNTGYQNSSQTVILQVSAGDYFEVIDYSENTGGQYCKDESHFIGYLIG